MTFLRKRNKIIGAVAMLAMWAACTKKWDDHNQVNDNNLKNNLYTAISQTPGLSKFSDMLVKTGYDKIISSSKTYTVWAPNDQALQSLSTAILNDTAQLKLFVANHITNQSYLEGAATGSLRLQMLNGKYNNVTGTTFDSANIVTANQYAANGVFHVIDKFIPRYDNCWEFLKNTTTVPLMKAFLLSQNYIFFDSTKATQIGADPSTGRPIWDSTNAKITRNSFLDKTVDVSNEAGLYTLVLMTDNAYTTETNKLTPWFKTSTADSTSNLCQFHLVKDLAFQGLYTPAQLPDSLLSSYGVKTPMVKSAIVASYKTSNGIVYIMNQVNYTKENKFPPIYIQGENPSGFMADRSSNTFYRVRYNPVTGKNFNDILMTNYNAANFFIYYIRKGMPSMRYNASWVAVNDIQQTPLWQQRLGGGYKKNDTLFVSTPFTAQAINYGVYTEVYQGQFNFSNYGDQYFLVYGPTTASTTGNTNAITMDYLRLDPAF